jgi:mono/diheme cytochrome c family protein
MLGPSIRLIGSTTLFAITLATAAADESPALPAPRFESQIQPILQAKCVRCHGGDTKESTLDLSSPQGILGGGESGPVIVPSDPSGSAIYQKVLKGEMPPGKNEHLSETQLATIRRWIEAGAPMTTDRPEVTQHDVLPVLLRHCTVCHGRQRQEAGLDLQSKASMLAGGKSGPAIVLGKPDESLLIKRIRAGEMPPKENLLNTGTRPLRESDIDRLGRWIELGAPEVAAEPDLAGTPDDPLVGENDRQFWAFLPPKQVDLPDQGSENPIDALMHHKLQQTGQSFAPAADPLTLLRRATFDLTGLPPTPAEIQAFEADSRRDAKAAYSHLIDRLLDSPRYGERLGRDWLDAVGYSDSWGGKLDADHLRPHAWRYRDYVIRSLNEDKPYDQFLLEQIAGDELVDYENAAVITDEIYDKLVATGFLRMGPDSTSEREVSFVSDRVDVIADEIDIFSSTVLGLTMKCARCHSHKYDPIPQRDYYRLFAIFKGAYDEYNWLKPVRGTEQQYKFAVRDLPFVTTAEREQYDQHNGKLNCEIDELKNQLNQKADECRKKHSKDDKFSIDELKKLDDDFKQEAEKTDQALKQLQGRLLPEPGIQALWDRGEPSPTYLYGRGDHDNPVRLIEPGVPAVLDKPEAPFRIEPPGSGAHKTGRRLSLARWVTQPDHPLTARVMVNRLWRHHFGTGIVPSVGNFGATGAPPSHSELLDFLAIEFVKQGWSMKAMHRLIMTSQAYQQSVSSTEFGMPLKRMDAEVLRDTMIFVAGRLHESRFGRPDAVTVRPDGLVTSAESDEGWRRSIYVQQRRKEIPTILETFDLPQMNPNCLQRTESTVAPQALHLMNNAMIDRLAESFAARVIQEAGDDVQRQVEQVYLIALSRPPDDEERRIGVDAIVELTKLWNSENRPDASTRALATYCHTILNSAAFLYID